MSDNNDWRIIAVVALISAILGAVIFFLSSYAPAIVQ